MIAHTEQTLQSAPFNKMRMTLFPKWYWFNKVEPEYFPYVGVPPTGWDFTMFNVSFWQRLDQRILNLQSAGIQVDLILFHPYDEGHWGFDCMGGSDADTYDTSYDEFYLKYVVARLGAYRNVWWSMANEWDLVACKRRGVPDSSPTWDRLFKTLAHEDVHGHLTSVHNCVENYDHSKPWITHISAQGWYDTAHIKRKFTPKPIIWDEVMYEGDIGDWGGLTAGQMADRFWWGFSYGAYVGHGETITYKPIADEDQVLWWSKGNVLRGESPPRIEWFSRLIEKLFDEMTCTCTGWGSTLCDDSCLGSYTMGDGVNVITDEATIFILHSSAENRPPHGPPPSTLSLPAGNWNLSPVDFWNMKVLPSSANFTSGGHTGVTVSAAQLTFRDLVTVNTTAPCERSWESCCSDDPVDCTPFVAILTLESKQVDLSFRML